MKRNGEQERSAIKNKQKEVLNMIAIMGKKIETPFKWSSFDDK
jgi:hypothetical protein